MALFIICKRIEHKKKGNKMAISINNIKVGDVIVINDVVGVPDIIGERLVVKKSQRKNDEWLSDNLPEYIPVVVTYQLTKDKKALLSGTKLTIDTISPLLSRVEVIDHLEDRLNIPAERE